MTLSTIVYPVRDLASAKVVFTAFLGTPPTSDTPYYVGYSVDGQQIGLDPRGEHVIAYREVPDVAKAVAELVEAGATGRQSPRDVGGGKLVATVADADGNVIGFIQPVS
jgi:catechol 2,3-dioxygenase-like lactoylglutathione lyase family enzyme